VASDTPPLITHPAPNPAWLAQRSEAVLDPDLPIVDTHTHFYEHQGYVYLLDDLLADLHSGHNVTATIFVQAYWSHRANGPEALRPVGETEHAVLMAQEAERKGARTRLAAGIVAYADLALGEAVVPVLAAHVEAAQGRLRGIRNITGRDPHFIASISEPPAFGVMGSDAFRAGFAQLRKFNLSYDAWLYHPQLNELIDLARAFPDTPIVMNHLGGPLGVGPYRGKRQEVFAKWHSSITELAACPNVYIKLGGQGMVLSGFDFNRRAAPPSSEELAAAWGPYVLAVIKACGVERCMFESNFPPDKNTASYVTIWNTFKRIAASASADEKRALFHDTAARFYRL
jgi:predicted TIM-barrel fold metal-dependent hydrolase